MQNEPVFIHTDGGSRGNPGPAACAFVAEQKGLVVAKGSKYLGKRTNNEAEYEGVMLALEWLLENNSLNVDVKFLLDSELVVRQLTGIYKIKKPELQTLSLKIKKLISGYAGKIYFNNVPREQNKIADLLLNNELDQH